MSDDEEYIAKKVPGRIYGSRSFDGTAYRRLADGQVVPEPQKLPYLDRVLPDTTAEVFGVVQQDLVLRTTRTGKRQIKAYVVESPRKIKTLVLQNFDMSKGQELPSKRAHFALVGHEIDDLLELANLAREGDFQVTGKFRIGVHQLERLEVSRDAVKALVSGDTTVLEEALRDAATERDMVAVAYRRKQIARFERLLSDEGYFKQEQAKTSRNSAEAVWQAYFEENHWIFGGTLFLNSAGAIDSGKLERSVAGASVAMPGKRVDALLRTRGRIGALCFVEIKCHCTPLLKSTSYRPGVWSPSDELSGAVSQLQRTIQLAERTIQKALTTEDEQGNPTAPPAHLVRPRSAVICGDLSECLSANGVNEAKYSSFELYRRHLQGPEIVTFDELLERARLMVDA